MLVALPRRSSSLSACPNNVLGLPAPKKGNHCPRVISKPPELPWEAVRLPQNTAVAFEPPLMGHTASSQSETVSPLAQHILGSYPRAESHPFFPLTGCSCGSPHLHLPFPSNFSLPLISSLYNPSILSSVQSRRSVSSAVGRLARQQADSDPKNSLAKRAWWDMVIGVRCTEGLRL